MVGSGSLPNYINGQWQPATATDTLPVINPATFHGQVEGSIVMGIGETLMEDTEFNDDGKALNPRWIGLYRQPRPPGLRGDAPQ